MTQIRMGQSPHRPTRQRTSGPAGERGSSRGSSEAGSDTEAGMEKAEGTGEKGQGNGDGKSGEGRAVQTSHFLGLEGRQDEFCSLWDRGQ